MKKISLSAACVLLAGSFLCSSCIGSFSLFNKYEKWQCTMTSNKYVNGIVGLILQPIVGGVCLFVDAVVLNTIEFWTGSNPMAINKVQTVKGQDGRYYAVKTLKNGYEVKAPNGEVTLFIHDSKTESWSISQNGVTKEIIRFNADGTIQASLQNGEKLTVTNDQAGMQKVREAVYNDNCFALR
ncbi:DUF3332 domain-containing protein [uncultured Prevotella sp.]|uniref:DUF3332 domain-containing protein n=1 Tax=uncultured Prevotella sp. TaxID=159272 RepID=UPI002588E4BF|nr:DUF3332 domain-containing protein [uncultured Prevotella sp.]